MFAGRVGSQSNCSRNTSMPAEIQRESDASLRDPVARFRADAESAGLIRKGDPLDQNVIDFAYRVVERCASIGDRYSAAGEEANAGEHIRAELGST